MQKMDGWLQRHHCNECGNTFVDQVEAMPRRMEVEPQEGSDNINMIRRGR